MKLWRREREQPVEPDLELEDRIADVLHRHGTYRGRDSVLYSYKAEARRRRQKARAGATASPRPERKESCSSETPDSAPQRTQPKAVSEAPAPSAEVVPSIAPVVVPGQKPEADFERERFEAFEILAGNGDRLSERLQEVRDYEPEAEPQPYLWDGGLS